MLKYIQLLKEKFKLIKRYKAISNKILPLNSFFF